MSTTMATEWQKYYRFERKFHADLALLSGTAHLAGSATE
jgi:hypothetical protein